MEGLGFRRRVAEGARAESSGFVVEGFQGSFRRVLLFEALVLGIRLATGPRYSQIGQRSGTKKCSRHHNTDS